MVDRLTGAWSFAGSTHLSIQGWLALIRGTVGGFVEDPVVEPCDVPHHFCFAVGVFCEAVTLPGVDDEFGGDVEVVVEAAVEPLAVRWWTARIVLANVDDGGGGDLIHVVKCG